MTITKSSNTIVLTADSRVSIGEKTIIKKGVEFLEIVDRIPRPWLPALSLDRKKKLEKKKIALCNQRGEEFEVPQAIRIREVEERKAERKKLYLEQRDSSEGVF